MNMKKFLSATLAVAMVLSIGAVSTFAADTATANSDGVYGGTINLAGELNIPEIKVTLPTAAGVLLNPYRLEVENESGDVIGSDGVMSPVYVFESETTVALDVGVIGTATVAGDVKLASEPLAKLADGAKAKNKEVFPYLSFLNDGDADSTSFPTYRGATAEALKSMLVLTSKTAKEATIIGSIAAGEEGTPSSSAFMIKGEAYAMTEDAWTSADKVDVTLIFSFTPSVDETAAPYNA